MGSPEEIYRVAVLTGRPGPGRPAYLDASGVPLGLGRALAVAREMQDASQGLVYCVVPEDRLAEETARAEAGRRRGLRQRDRGALADDGRGRSQEEGT